MNTEKQISIASEGAGLLKLGPRKGEYIDVGIERQSLLASTRVYLYDDNRGLLRLFEELAANFGGVDGKVVKIGVRSKGMSLYRVPLIS